MTVPSATPNPPVTGGAPGTGDEIAVFADGLTTNRSNPALISPPAAAATPCFCAGTLIAVKRGEVPVEALRIGDRVRTLSGALRPIRWIGRRSYDGRFAARNPAVLPVIFQAGSLGNGLPRRDLSVSPLHAMMIDGVLIPAGLLVNGETIVQPRAASSVTYVHVELESHDILLAEGAPSESFVDDGGRGLFQNAAEFERLYPGALSGPARYCLPRVEDGPALERAWRRLSGVTDGVTSGLRGFVDGATPDLVHGWVRDSDALGRRVQVIVRAGGTTIGIATADLWRPDVAAAGEGDGWHGFEFRPRGLLGASSGRIEVVVATCRTVLPWADTSVVRSPGLSTRQPNRF